MSNYLAKKKIMPNILSQYDVTLKVMVDGCRTNNYQPKSILCSYDGGQQWHEIAVEGDDSVSTVNILQQ